MEVENGGGGGGGGGGGRTGTGTGGGADSETPLGDAASSQHHHEQQQQQQQIFGEGEGMPQIMVVPPLDCAWLTREEYMIDGGGEKYIVFEAKGEGFLLLLLLLLFLAGREGVGQRENEGRG